MSLDQTLLQVKENLEAALANPESIKELVIATSLILDYTLKTFKEDSEDILCMRIRERYRFSSDYLLSVVQIVGNDELGWKNILSAFKEYRFHITQKYPRSTISKQAIREINSRDNSSCRVCREKKFLEYQHIIPVKYNGNSLAKNVMILCSTCHRKVSRVDPLEETIRARYFPESAAKPF